jgi:hypothetical protein
MGHGRIAGILVLRRISWILVLRMNLLRKGEEVAIATV